MLNPIEKSKVAILHLDMDWNDCFYFSVMFLHVHFLFPFLASWTGTDSSHAN